MEVGDQTVIRNPGWWRRRTALDKTLPLIIIVGILAVGCSPTSNGVSNNICLTPGCNHAASYILDAMNATVEPCDNFYNFACGGFIKNTQIPDEKVAVNTFSIIDDRLKEQLRTIFSEEPKPGESKPFTLARDLYRACMNTSLLEERGIEPFKVILDTLGGWPVVKGDSWDDQWTWEQSAKDFRKAGYSMDYIFSLTVVTDLKNSLSRSIYIGQPTSGLDAEFSIKGLDEFFLALKIFTAYYNFMVDTAVIYGADRLRAEIELKNSMDFEVALVKICLPKEKLRNGTAVYNPMTLKDMQVKYPYVPWVEYINALLPTGLSVVDNETIIVTVPTYFDQLGALLEKTPKRTIANYLMWRMILDSIPYLTENLRSLQLTYATAVSGKRKQSPRWKECIKMTSDSLPIPVGAMYVRRYFQENSKQAAVEMMSGIRAQFEMTLAETPWMDPDTKAAALDKAKAMYTHIGYPDELMDNVKLEQLYSALEVNPDQYLESVLRMNVLGTDYAFNKLRKPVNKTDWVYHASPATVNAFYSPGENSIRIPAGILQGQFFSAERPRYLNYGAIGFIIGHEITHGFDDQGRQFDLNGNLVDWWNTETEAQYLEKATCVMEQYGNFTEPTTKMQLTGIKTIGENIADNGGIKESYLAYLKFVKDNAPEPTLPGLNYTPQQLFWISSAQTWCSVYRDESMKLIITGSDHSPERFRVLGPLSNMKDFSKDFNCPLGSPMNPRDKCEVW